MMDFLQHARARGLVIDSVITDGKIHRVPVEGKPKTDKTGWYVYHAGGDRAFAVYGRWDDGLPDDSWFENSDTKLSPAEKQHIQATRQAINVQKEQGYQDAANAVQKIFDVAAEAKEHPYLKKKAVQLFGLKVDGNALLIPLRDAAGVLWSLQRILPNGEKRFHPGGKITGCFHWLSDPAGSDWLLLAEGYATAATIHEATGLPIAAAMNCGNLLPAAEAIAKQYPNAKILICADDDKATETKIGKNPGVDAAKAVLRVLNKGQAQGRKRARYAIPEGKEGYGSDFNDLALSSGMDAVRQQIESAIGKKPARKLEVLPKKESAGKKSQSSSGVGNNSGNNNRDDNGNNGSGGGSDYPRTYFTADDAGVFYHGVDKNGNPLSPFRVCSPLYVTARTRDIDNQEWGYLIELPDYEGKRHQWPMPARLLAGDGNECRSNLLSMGLRIEPGSHAKNLLIQYLQSARTDTLARCTDVIGWYGESFVLPDRCIGGNDEKVIFQSAASSPNTFRQKGTVTEWKENIGQYCAGNSRLVFAVSVAFAGSLLKIAGLESGGFHLRGASSVGKTCALKVAASVFGGDDFMQRWRLTDNAMEGMAAQHSDTVLILDEISMADPKTVGECAYMLANETGKARMARTGAPRARLAWRLLFLSSGEKSLADHMGEVNKRSNAGQEVRICDLPADAGAGLGLFETLHRFNDPKTLHRWLTVKAKEHYGEVGIAYLTALTKHLNDLPQYLKRWQKEFGKGLLPEAGSGQVYRAANRFALVAAAGEIATQFDLTGWKPGEATKAAQACFNAWLEARGGIGATEEMQMLAQARHFFEQSHSRFEWWHRTLDDHAPSVLNRCGFKRTFFDGKPHDFKSEEDRIHDDEKTTMYYVLPESFRTEVCKGFDLKTMCRLLRDEGVLLSEKGRFDRSERLPGLGKMRCYRINPAAFSKERKATRQDADTDIEVTI